MTNIENINNPAKNRQGKRREVNKEECLFDLKKDLPKMFLAFNRAVKLYNKTMIDIPLESRIRVEAPMLNTRIVQCIQEVFPSKWKFGKYKRFILSINGYLILFKKLNAKSKPMNIQTKHVNTISNQLALSLFEDDYSFLEPILFFGYKKDRQGEIISPQLVYIDEDMVKWVITENEVSVIEMKQKETKVAKEADVALKKGLGLKEASNN